MPTIIILAVLIHSCQSTSTNNDQLSYNDRRRDQPSDITWKDDRDQSWKLHQKLSWNQANKACKNASYKLGELWRLPSPIELKELFSRELRKPSKVRAAHPFAHLGNTWTSRWDHRSNRHNVIYVNLSRGKEYIGSPGHKFSTICIKSMNAEGDQWSDPIENLTWRFYPHRVNWKQGKKTCDTLNNIEHIGWRLPKSEEIEKAIKHGIQTPINPFFGYKNITQTWSDNEENGYPEEAYAVDLSNKHIYLSSKKESLSLLCVHEIASIFSLRN